MKDSTKATIKEIVKVTLILLGVYIGFMIFLSVNGLIIDKVMSWYYGQTYH